MKKGTIAVLLCVLCGLHVLRFELAADERPDATPKAVPVGLDRSTDASNSEVVAESQSRTRLRTDREAVVDVNFIFKNLPEFKRKMDEVKQSVLRIEKELRILKLQTDSPTARVERLRSDRKYRAFGEAETPTEIKEIVDKKRKEILQREAEVYHETFEQITAEIADYAKRNGISIVRRADSPLEPNQKVDASDGQAVLKSINRPLLFVADNRKDTQPEDITQAILHRLLARGKPRGAPANDID